MNRVIQAWKDNGLPPNVPFFMTEGNDLGEGGTGHREKRPLAGRLCRRDDDRGRGRHLLLPLHRGAGAAAAASCRSTRTIASRYYPPQYLAAQVITKEWVQPVDAIHKLFEVASDVKDQEGNMLVTAYAVERPDGQWSVMLINKDEDNDHSVKVAFTDALTKRDRSSRATWTAWSSARPNTCGMPIRLQPAPLLQPVEAAAAAA